MVSAKQSFKKDIPYLEKVLGTAKKIILSDQFFFKGATYLAILSVYHQADYLFSSVLDVRINLPGEILLIPSSNFLFLSLMVEVTYL